MARSLLIAALLLLALGQVAATRWRRNVIYSSDDRQPSTTASGVAEDSTDGANTLDTDDIDTPIVTPRPKKSRTSTTTEALPTETTSDEVVVTPEVVEEEKEWIPPAPPEHPPLPNPYLQPCSIPGCPVAVVNNTYCFSELSQAIEAAPDNGVVEIGTDLVAGNEIVLSKSIELRSCGRQRWTITVELNSTEGTLLRQIGADVNVSLTNLKFILADDRMASVLRTPKIPEVPFDIPVNETDEMGYMPEELPDDGYPNVDVFIQGCRFENFRTGAIGGSVISISQSSWFTILNSKFVNNTVLRTYKRFEGAGTIWMRIFDGYRFTVNDTLFANNHHLFQHGIGGAIGLNYLSQGYLEIHHSRFVNNSASGGGAVCIECIEDHAKFVVNGGIFQNNTAREYGWGSRGGALWLQNINGTVTVVGLFQNNSAPDDRGAVIANNMLRRNATVTLGGVFLNNTCLKGGALWDTSGSIGFHGHANFTVAQNSILFNNSANSTDRIIRLLQPRKDSTTFITEKTWKGDALVVVA